MRWGTDVARRHNKKVASNATVECSVIRVRAAAPDAASAAERKKKRILPYAVEL